MNNEPFLSSQNGLPRLGSFPSPSYAVYPLYYGGYSQPMEPQLKLGDPSTSKSISNARPEIDLSRNFSLCNEENTIMRRDQPNIPISPPINECDLSLRLGISSVQEDEKSLLNGFQEKIKVMGSRKESKERFSLYPENNASSANVSLDINLMVRKRKAVDQDPHHSWEPKFMPTYSSEGTRTAG